MKARQKQPPAEGMKRYTGYVSVGLVGCKRTFEFEIEDDASEQEVEDAARDAMFQTIEWGFEETE
ncbi:MAG: hypothetical protein WC807_18520 [Hyphomicrobium sp.]|jgi:hypothetical protein